jgi:serine/threonine protein kinase
MLIKKKEKSKMSKQYDYSAGDKIKLGKNAYQIEGVLGDGGFGTVFDGKVQKDQKRVAIKQFKTQAFTSAAECRMYWERESELTEIQSSFPGRHMEFIESYEDKSDRANPKFFIVLGFVKGQTLKTWFNDNLRAPENQRISVDDMTQKIFIPLAEYMDYCHTKGIVHRDFTFNNIMIINTGNDFYPIVIDWGGGKKYDADITKKEPPLIEDMEGSGTCIITPGFFAPEIIQQKPPLPQTDIYMFGAVLFYALTNGYTRVKPTVASDYVLHPQDYNMNVSDTLNDIVEKCTQYEPRDRFRTFNDAKQALEQHLGGKTSGLDQLPQVSNENAFVFHVLNNNAFLQFNFNDMILEDNKNIRVGREMIIEAAPWKEEYKGVFRGITRIKVDGTDREREQFYLGYSKTQNLFFISEGRNANHTYLNGQPLIVGQWTPIKVADQISIGSTTVRGVFELISVLDLNKK